MKKRFYRKPFAILTAFVIIFSLVLLTGNDLITENIVFAAGNLEDKNVTVDFDGDTTIFIKEEKRDDEGKVDIEYIEYTEGSDQKAKLFDITKASFTQEGTITVGYESIEKEAILLIDSCYKSTRIPGDDIGLFEKCLFSFNDLTIQGNDTKIYGDVFALNDLIVKSSRDQVHLGEDANIEYTEFKSDKNNPPQNAQAFFEDADRSGKVQQVSDDKRDEVNEYIRKSEDRNNPSGFIELFRYIQQKAADPPQRDKAQFLFDESTAEHHFGSGNVANYDKNTIIKRYDPAPYDGSNEYTQNYYNYKITDSDFILRYSMYFDGNLKISVPYITKDLLPGTEIIFIYAEGDIFFQGNSSDLTVSDTLFLMSRHGNITFQPGQTALTAIVFAPEGNVTIQGNNVEFNGCFAGKNVYSEASGSTFIGPSEDTTEKIEDEFIFTKGFENVISAINYLPESFDKNTKVGVIKYSDCADINDNNVRNDWTLYDMNPENGNGKNTLKEYISKLTADKDTERSNLGDAMRRALGVFQSDLSDTDSEKFLIIFSGMDPNAYSATEYNYVTDVNTDITRNSDDIRDEGSQPFKSGNGYVEEMIRAIDEYNNLNDANIHIIFVDLSLFRQDSNLNDDGTPKEIIPQLIDLADNLGINIGPGETQVTAPNGNVYYRPTKEEVENSASEHFIINKIAEYTNGFNTRLAVKDLEINSAEFKLRLPKSLQPANLLVEDINGNELDTIDLSTITATGDSYIVEHIIDTNVSKFARVITTDEGKTYTLDAGKITIDLYVNNADGSFSSSSLKTIQEVNSAGPTITYEFIDGKGKTYSFDLAFDNIKFNVIYEIDIN